MAKGLPRSLARGRKARQEIVKEVREFDVTFTVAASGSAAGLGTAVIGDLPEGNILLLGAVCYVQFSTADTDFTATWDGSFGVGTTADADGTIVNTTDADIVQQTTIAAATSRVSPLTRGVGPEIVNGTPLVVDNTDGSLELNLNLVVDAADVTDGEDGEFNAVGKLHLAYIVLGDD